LGFSLRPSAYLCVGSYVNAEAAEIRRGPQSICFLCLFVANFAELYFSACRNRLG
jgi:hypothetical protein